MQHSDPKKKKSYKKNQRDTSKFANNVTASLRLMQKTNPDDTSQIYLLAAATVNVVGCYCKDWVNARLFKAPAVLPTPAPTPVDVEADSHEIMMAFTKLEAQILILQQERSQIAKTIRNLKEDKKNAALISPQKAAAIVIDPKLNKRQLQILAEVDVLLIEKIKLIPEMIREHAARRVDLFFLLSIAVYNKKVTITKGSTVLQHGQGSKKTGTAGCHASLIPNPVITPNSSGPGMAVTAGYWIAGLFQPTVTTTNKAPAPFTINGTYLEDILNMTTELPTVVNDFDGQMEGKFEQSTAVNECLSILNKVADGSINPIEALAEFCHIMKLFFDHMEYRYFRREEPSYTNSGMILYPMATKLIWQCEKEGTFRAFDLPAKKPKAAYVHMMLKLQTLPTTQKAVSLVYSGYINQRIQELQDEILSSESYAASNAKKSGKK